jgi:Outer membrane protein beta-barrel domain
MKGIPRTVSAALMLLAPVLPATAQAPTGSAAPAAAFGEGVYIYPKNGQSEQQLWSDRYACDTWSRTQSGFDPVHTDGGAPAGEVAKRREEYRNAMTACLDAKGYSIGPRPAAPIEATPHTAPIQKTYVPPASKPADLGYRALTAWISAGYTMPNGSLKTTLDDGGNAEIGFTLFPSPWLPIGLRIDGSYSRFSETLAADNQEAAALGTTVDYGRQSLYGGDVDVQLDLAHRGTGFKMYLFGGAGWYRNTTDYRQVQWSGPMLVCGYYTCGYGYLPYEITVAHSTTPWTKSWNAGFGMEFALTPPASLFIEARYVRLAPYASNMAYVPINIGLRF